LTIDALWVSGVGGRAGGGKKGNIPVLRGAYTGSKRKEEKRRLLPPRGEKRSGTGCRKNVLKGGGKGGERKKRKEPIVSDQIYRRVGEKGKSRAFISRACAKKEGKKKRGNRLTPSNVPDKPRGRKREDQKLTIPEVSKGGGGGKGGRFFTTREKKKKGERKRNNWKKRYRFTGKKGTTLRYHRCTRRGGGGKRYRTFSACSPRKRILTFTAGRGGKVKRKIST